MTHTQPETTNLEDDCKAATGPRILFIQTQGENAGAQEITRVLGAGLSPKGYDVHHLFFYRKSATFEASPNTRFCSIERPRNPIEFARFLIKLYSIIREIKPDIVLTFQHYGNMFGAPAAWLAGVKHIIANQVSAPKMMNRLVVTVDKILGTIGLYDLITVNTFDTASIYADFPQIYKNKIVHVPHGFREKHSELNKSEARAKFGLPQDVVLLGSVARLNSLKRLDVSIRTLTHNPDWHLVLGGQGPQEEELRSLARELGVEDRTYFTGEMDSADVGDLLAALDLFIFPSEAETFGLAPVEAAQFGLPVVVNGLPVLREVLKTDLGPCALFADSENPPSYADPVTTLLADKQMASQLIRSGRALKALYSMDAMVSRYDELISEQLQDQTEVVPVQTGVTSP